MSTQEPNGAPPERLVLAYPVPLGIYRDHAQLEAEAEATDILSVLAPFLGGNVVDWPIAPPDRHAGQVGARLRQFAKEKDNNTVLVWVGHGRSYKHNAALVIPGVREPIPEDEDEDLLPAQFALSLVKQVRRRTASDPPPWTLVLIEACGAGRFVELVNNCLVDEDANQGVALIGIGDPYGEAFIGTAKPLLQQVIASSSYSNGTDIRLNDLVTDIEERLGGATQGQVSRGRLVGCKIRRSRIVVSTTFDVYPRLRNALDKLPERVREHFAAKGMGADFGELTWSFVGRSRERARIVSHLANGSGILAVTGPAGAGKSAVLGNILLRTQPELRQVLTSAGFLDEDPPSPEEAALKIDLWVQLSGLTFQEAAQSLAKALRVAPVTATPDARVIAPLVTAQEHRQVPFRMVADGLDESRDPERIANVLQRLAEAGACVVVGTRPSVLESLDHPALNIRDLLDELRVDEPHLVWVNNDLEALRSYLFRGLTRLQPPASPGLQQRIIESFYLPSAIQADPRSTTGRGFLYARLLLEELAAHPDRDEPTLTGLLAGNHRTIFGEAMQRIGTRHPMVAHLLEALAHARGNGIPRAGSVWATITQSLCGAEPSRLDIERTLEQAAPYITIGAEDGQTVFRLAHQTFREYFMDSSGTEKSLRVIVGLLELANNTVADPNPYLVSYLPSHVVEAGQSGWELLAQHEMVLDVIDPDAVSRELMRTAMGQVMIPAQLAGVLASLDPLRGCAPSDRQGIRQLGTAWFSSYSPTTKNPAAWSVLTAQRFQRTPHLALVGHAGAVTAVTVFATQQGKIRLATAGEDATVRIWDSESGREIGGPLLGHAGPVRAVAAFTTKQGQVRLASASDDLTVRIWDPDTGDQIREPLRGHTKPVVAVTAFTTELGQVLLVTGSEDSTVRIWSPGTDHKIRRGVGHVGPVTAVTTFATKPGLYRLVTASEDATVRIWDPESGRQIRRLRGSTGGVLALTSFTIDPGQVLLATGSADKTVRIWDPETGEQIRRLRGHTGAVTAVTALRANQGQVLLATGSTDEMVRIWDPETGEQIRRRRGYTGTVWAVTAFSTNPGQVLLATGGNEDRVRIWDLETGEQVCRLRAHTDSVLAMTALTTEQGQIRLATASADQTVRIWDPETGDVIRRLSGHTGEVRRVTAFTTEQGQVRLATASTDQTVRIWDLDHRQPLHTLGLHSRVSALGSLPDGTLVVGLVDGWARVQPPLEQ